MPRIGLFFITLALIAAGPPKPWNGTIHGSYVGPDGKPLVGATVRVFDRNVKTLPGKPFELAGPAAEPKTDKDGKFRADNIPPGTYWVSVCEPTGRRGFFIHGASKPFKLSAGATMDTKVIKTVLEDLRPDFLKGM